jgi:hypothetical protein
LAAKATGDVNVAKPKASQPVELKRTEWLNENRKATVHDTGPSDTPPPWAHGTWSITRFEVLENGAVLRLWYVTK